MTVSRRGLSQIGNIRMKKAKGIQSIIGENVESSDRLIKGISIAYKSAVVGPLHFSSNKMSLAVSHFKISHPLQLLDSYSLAAFFWVWQC